jgi:hypothetical protein
MSRSRPGGARSAPQRWPRRSRSCFLVLLCYKKPRRQQGHLGRERAKWVAIRRCRVAIEDGLCRSVRTGSAARRVAGLRTG